MEFIKKRISWMYIFLCNPGMNNRIIIFTSSTCRSSGKTTQHNTEAQIPALQPYKRFRHTVVTGRINWLYLFRIQDKQVSSQVFTCADRENEQVSEQHWGISRLSICITYKNVILSKYCPVLGNSYYKTLYLW